MIYVRDKGERSKSPIFLQMSFEYGPLGKGQERPYNEGVEWEEFNGADGDGIGL